MNSLKRTPATAPATGNPLADQLARRLETRKACVVVVGLGYVGLPLARGVLAAAGSAVLGFDTDANKVQTPATTAKATSGTSTPSPRARTPPASAKIRGHRRLRARYRRSRRDPDLRPHAAGRVPRARPRVHRKHSSGPIDRRTPAPRPGCRPGSTTYPGTTRRRCMRAAARESVRAARRNRLLHVAYSPEREDPGNRAFRHPSAFPKSSAVSKRIQHSDSPVALYAAWSKVVEVSSSRGRRGVQDPRKYLSRDQHRPGERAEDAVRPRWGIDVWEVIEAAKTKPFGFQAFYPGPGLGGHCIPIDPFYLTWVARQYGSTRDSSNWPARSTPRCPQYVVDRGSSRR